MAFLKNSILVLFLMVSSHLFALKAQRIVSLAPSLTKNIYFLGAQDQLLGCTNYCTEALADGKEVVASAIKVNVEKTVSLHPDLVLVTTITSPETIAMLKKLGVLVEVFETPKNFKEICDQFIRLGQLTDHQEKAKEIIQQTTDKINALKSTISTENQPNVFFQIGADPIFTVLANTFMNDYITLAGGENIAGELKHGTMTRESVLVKNPEYIFIVTMGMTGDSEKQIWQRFDDLAATQQHNIFIVDAEKACSPTPITFADTFENIVHCMNQQR
ncbi:MAG: ABC transporter substrate-binding protein [Prolixibacteraceae bacterium]